MKKLLLTTTFLAAGVIGLFAQGKIAFDNQVYNFNDSIENGGSVDYKVYFAGGMTAGNEINDATWTAQLFQNGTALGDKIPFYGNDQPGVWNANAPSEDPLFGSRTLVGVAAGGTATGLEVRIFDGTGTFRGASATFDYKSPSSPTAPASDYYMNNFRGFSVPEPSTIALGVLGLGALLLFRRNK
jgi:hypothetical protein